MTDLMIVATTAHALPKLAIDSDGTSFTHPNGRVEPIRAETYTASDGYPAIRAIGCKYLVPLLAKPVCSTCEGSGEVGRVSLDLLIGHRGLTPLASALFRPCPDCSDGVPLGQVQLVVERTRGQAMSAFPRHGWLCDVPNAGGCFQPTCNCPCHQEPLERVVASGELVQLLPIEVVVPKADRAPETPAYSTGHDKIMVHPLTNTMHWFTGNNGRDISHLLPLTSWPVNGWAGIITGLEIST